MGAQRTVTTRQYFACPLGGLHMIKPQPFSEFCGFLHHSPQFCEPGAETPDAARLLLKDTEPCGTIPASSLGNSLICFH